MRWIKFSSWKHQLKGSWSENLAGKFAKGVLLGKESKYYLMVIIKGQHGRSVVSAVASPNLGSSLSVRSLNVLLVHA